jgi:hypothetical protein
MAPFAFIVHHGHRTIEASGLDEPVIIDCMKEVATGMKEQLEKEGVLTFVAEPNQWSQLRQRGRSFPNCFSAR